MLYSIAKSTPHVLLIFLKVENTNCENFHLIQFLSSSSPSHITRKLYHVCQYYKYQTTALLLERFHFWFYAVCELQSFRLGRATKQYSTVQDIVVQTFPWILHIHSRHGENSLGMSGQQVATSFLATNCVPRSFTILFSISWFTSRLFRPAKNTIAYVSIACRCPH